MNQEIRCGYTIEPKMKRIWAIEMGMLKEFIDVCKTNNLKYYIMGGTLLGAVRHKGYIPWDNDIDVAMPRPDFNKLLEIGASAFKSPSFFQTPVTEDSRYFCTYIKIRNSDSTAASVEEYKTGMNCGLFIDVFCFDELPDDNKERKHFINKLKVINNMYRFCLNKASKNGAVSKIKYFIQKMIWKVVYGAPNASKLFIIYQKEAGKYWGQGNHQLSHLAFGFHNNFVWDKKDWEHTVLLPFEDMELVAPAGYDNILKIQYGDYMRIPEDKSTHDYFDFEPDVPYKEYFNNK